MPKRPALSMVETIRGVSSTIEMPTPSAVTRGASSDEKYPIVLGPVATPPVAVRVGVLLIWMFKPPETINDSLSSGQRSGVGA